MSITEGHKCVQIRGLRRIPPVYEKSPVEALLPRGLRVIKPEVI